MTFDGSMFTPGQEKLAHVPGASDRLNQVVTVVRSYTRDRGHFNRLISGEESSDTMIAWAVMDALSLWNSIPPLLSSLSLKTFPQDHMHLLVRATVCNLLESVAILQTRNYMAFSDGGAGVTTDDKTVMLMNLRNILLTEVKQGIREIKICRNIDGGWGNGLHSEYLDIHGRYL